MQKNFYIGEKYRIQFRAEGFNIFNQVNFIRWDNPDASTSSSLAFDGVQFLGDGSPNPNFGKPTNGAFGTLGAAQPPREFQFGLKFSF